MVGSRQIGGGDRPIDADLKFWGAVAGILTKPPPPVVAPTRMAEVRSNFWFGLGLLATVYASWCVYDRFLGPLPSEVHRVSVANHDGNVSVGGSLRVNFDLFRHRTCQRSFWWIVSDHTGHRQRFAEPPMDAIGKPGPDSFSQDFRIPDDMMPGRGRLRIIWSWSCAENLFEAVYPVPLVIDDIKFDIVPKPAS